MFNFSGKRPKNLGVQDGKLAPCPNKPNCVCSQAQSGTSHHVLPFTFEGDRAEAMTRLVAVLLAQPNCKIITQSKDYIHAEFSTRLMGFVDDVEFYLPQGNELHVRSASRLGHSDLGVNRARVEDLRAAFNAAD